MTHTRRPPSSLLRLGLALVAGCILEPRGRRGDADPERLRLVHGRLQCALFLDMLLRSHGMAAAGRRGSGWDGDQRLVWFWLVVVLVRVMLMLGGPCVVILTSGSTPNPATPLASKRGSPYRGIMTKWHQRASDSAVGSPCQRRQPFPVAGWLED